MNTFKKINTYLLENHPLIWHSKTIQLTIAGSVFWIISFLSGYGYVNLNLLKHQTSSTYYQESNFIFFQIIFSLIIVCFWAISFYKNNPFKSFYPLKKGYFTKLFLLLFLPFFLLSSAYIPYMKGVNSKIHTFFDRKEFVKEIDEINLANVFLIQNESNYYISNRTYPNPYPVQSVFYDENKGAWELPMVTSSSSDSKEVTTFNISNSDSTKSMRVGKRKVQFYKTKVLHLDHNNCKTETVLDKFYSRNELDNPELYSILNNSVLFRSSYFHDNNSRYDYEALNDPEIDYKTKYAPTIYNWVKGKNYSKIKKSINKLKQICDKYSVEYLLNTNHIVRYLEYKNFKDFDKITRNYPNYNSNFINLENTQNEINRIQSSLNEKDKFIELLEKQQIYYFNGSHLDQIFSNFDSSEASRFDLGIMILFCFIAFSLVWLFIAFEFATVKSFLITIPIAGILLVINVLIGVMHFNGDDFRYSFLTTSTVILILTFLGVKLNFFRKKITTILFNLSYIIVPFYLILIVLIYNDATNNYSYLDNCNQMQYSSHDSFLVNPIFFFLFSLIGIFTFFGFLKKWKSLEE